ncbi:MAG: YbaN family protein [Dysgonomonas sp.]|uniref:YbaN family protein n=1 Tax=unclassified Dysgonomonas TaxID=2630389 RepID=UPI0025BE2D8D|nr:MULTISPECIES: YbaN family protein [unclassified Dysgonomonas]MDR1714918.1 YbaN family protein [Prevotella sp.]MDR2004599.1 YbaN family protein [Prevotella sp.]HMM02110.1 YbaN family protein [Dysgonomonas sp.]
MRYVYIILGFISLGLGLLGIITPGLPTTPFILLTGVLFAKSSPRLHQKLMDHKLTGKYIRRVNDGFSWKGLALSIGIMWCMIFFTAFVVFGHGTMRFVMLGLGLIGTVAQIIVLSKKKRKKALLMPIDLPDNNEVGEDKLKVS